MPDVAIYNKDRIGNQGLGMTAAAFRKVKARLEKGVDIRIRASVSGVARFSRVSQGDEDHDRTGIGGLILSVVVSETVTEEEWALNPLA